MPRTRANQVIDLTQDEDSDFQYALLLQEQEIANAESLLTDPGDHSFYMHPSSSVSRSSYRRNHRSLRYQPFPVTTSDAFDDSYEALINLSERIGDAKPKGVDKSQIERLPSTTVLAEEGNCSICLSDYEIGDMIKGLPCTHRFHVACIDTWLKESRFCPMYVCFDNIRIYLSEL